VTVAEQNEVKEEVAPTLKRYIAEIVLSKEPLQKDLYVGSYVYRDTTKSLALEDANPGCASDLEGLMEGDLSVPDDLGGLTFVSVNENPKGWVVNSISSNEFSGHPYAIGRVFELDEAE
jgi:hypothetical protein